MPEQRETSMASKPWLKRTFDELTANMAQGRLAHAILLTGPAGLGKHALASELAWQLLCTSPRFPKPCMQCTSCALVASNSHPDLRIIRPLEGKQVIGIDAIRSLVEQLTLHSHQGNFRAVVFPELAHTTFAAANSLLKLLEEPPNGTFFLCCTAHPGLLIPTIRSRMQLYSITPPSRSTALNWLHQSHHIDKLEAEKYLTLAQGAPLKVAAMIQNDFSQQRQQVLNLIMLCHTGSSSGVMSVVRNLTAYPLRSTLSLLAACLFDLLVLRASESGSATDLHFPDKYELLHNCSKKVQPRHLFAAYDQLLYVQQACVKSIVIDPSLQLFNLAVLIAGIFRSQARSSAA